MNVDDRRDVRNDVLVEEDPEVRTIEAGRRPAVIRFDPFARVTVPASLTATSGNAVHALATLRLWQRGDVLPTRCLYRRTRREDRYSLIRCHRPHAGDGPEAGDMVDVRRLELRTRLRRSAASVDLDVVPLRFPGSPDGLVIAVFDADFNEVLNRSGLIERGDLEVE